MRLSIRFQFSCFVFLWFVLIKDIVPSVMNVLKHSVLFFSCFEHRHCSFCHECDSVFSIALFLFWSGTEFSSAKNASQTSLLFSYFDRLAVVLCF